eukprot:11369768-Alexandrium_andersonii.AAC.1
MSRATVAIRTRTTPAQRASRKVLELEAESKCPHGGAATPLAGRGPRACGGTLPPLAGRRAIGAERHP